MQIIDNCVVSFNYVLNDANGEQLDSSGNAAPMTYLHGRKSLLAGLEMALEGKSAGEKFSVTLPPEQAFGEIQEGSEQRVPISHLINENKKTRKWQPGMQALIKTPHGHQQVTVVKAGHTMATIDTNHPMAGKTVVFNIDVIEVREASPEELAHGHAHGPGGHQH